MVETKMRKNLTILRDYHASLTSYAGIRLVTLGDGAERGVRVLELRSGGGLYMDILVDRNFDIDRLSINEQVVSWHTQNGIRAPWLIDPFAHSGHGFERGLSGFLCTCGYDHIRQPEGKSGANGEIDANEPTHYPLHGEGAFQPGRLVGYGIDEYADEPYLWCEGEMIQSNLFTGALKMTRRITVPLGGRSFSIRDRVRNVGQLPMAQMLMYHFNIGHPLIGPKTRVVSDQLEQAWMNVEHDIYDDYGEPKDENVEELTVHRLLGQQAGCRIENPDNGLLLEMMCSTKSLPYLQLLRYRGKGFYMMGIEPCTTKYRSRKDARDGDELLILEPNEFQDYSVDMTLDQS